MGSYLWQFVAAREAICLTGFGNLSHRASGEAQLLVTLTMVVVKVVLTPNAIAVELPGKPDRMPMRTTPDAVKAWEVSPAAGVWSLQVF